MATRKKTPQKHYDILRGMEIVESEPEEQFKIDPAVSGEDKTAVATVKLSASGNPPTVEDVLQREYPEVLRHPDPLNVQIAILRELIRMRGCE